MVNYLITGSSGYIGSKILNYLALKGIDYLGIDKNESLSHEHQVSTWQQAVDFVAKNRAGITALPTVIAKDIEPHHFNGVTRIKMPDHQLGLYMSSRFAKSAEASVSPLKP